MARSADVLLIDETSDPNFVQRLRSLPGVRVVRAATPEAVRLLSADPAYGFRVVLLPASYPLAAQELALEALRPALDAGSLSGIVFGERPVLEVERYFDEQGFKLALWNPFDERTLRFQMNRAFLRGRRMGTARSELRVPVECRARVCGGPRTKDALVYSLSRTGAFLQTSCPSPVGARLEVSLLLPDRTLSLPAQVVHTNVPGNLQRLSSPLGMGVRFVEPSVHLRQQLESLVRLRDRALSI